MSRLGICVLGAGDMGRTHLGAWQTVRGAEPIAVCDIDEERAQAAKEEFGVGECFALIEEALDETGIDIVSVCLPTHLHRRGAEGAMRRGIHVLCEKPLAMTIEDGKAMIAAARGCGVKFALGFCKRFMEQTQTMRELVQAGAIGRPVMYRVVSGVEIRFKPWIMDKQEGGGPLIDTACHYFDQWRVIFGCEPVRVMAMGTTFSTGAPELPGIDSEIDTASVLVEFASGDMGLLSLSWGLPRGTSAPSQEHVLGKDGVVRLEGGRKLTVMKQGGEEEVRGGLDSDMHPKQVAAFAEAVREDGPVAATGEDGLAALRVSLAALESARTGQACEVTRP
ncbi:MAG: Gfo/Idh/MocA family oxidoreductase [Armatimonadota bacterium]|jgi:myo-inositol 2-dehydrogenase/D-chiro-inositol 1-dehydrogenase